MTITVLAAALTLGVGALDVATFTRLGEVFASVMTGNLVLFGLAAARTSGSLAVHSAVAFAGYLTGAAAGTRLAGRSRQEGPVWPRSVTTTLLIGLVVLAGFTIGWLRTGAYPRGGTQLVLLATVAAAMGLQTAAMRGLGGNVSVSTTYLTGTLTGVISALVGPRPRRIDSRGLLILAAAATGAAIGGTLIAIVPDALPALPLAALSGVILVAGTQHVRSSP
ncbi:MAG: YoaK family protein [Sciscionella sp.]